MEKTKPFNIPKKLFVQAYELVKANAGAAGVDKLNKQIYRTVSKQLRSTILVKPDNLFQIGSESKTFIAQDVTDINMYQINAL